MGIDPSEDPELAHAMKMSLQEEAAKEAASTEEPLNPEPTESGITIRLRLPDAS